MKKGYRINIRAKRDRRIKKPWRRAAMLALAACLCLSAGGCGLTGTPQDEEAAGLSGAAGGEAWDKISPGDGAGIGIPGESEGSREIQEAPWENLEFDTAFYPYYGMLSENEQAVYRQTSYCIRNDIRDFVPCENVRSSNVDRVISAVYNDQPGFFWMEADYEYRHRSGQVTGIILHFNELADRLEESRRQFEEASASVLSEAGRLQTVQEKERYVHDTLLSRVIYEEGAPYNQNAYSALVTGASVCAGYARAFQYLMMELGVPCYYCVGTAVSLGTPEPAEEIEAAKAGRDEAQDGPETEDSMAERKNRPVEDHAWNIICLDGSYYNVDPTWNDTLLEEYDLIYYGYYNRSDQEFLTDHTRSERSRGLPSCTGGEYSFENIYGIPAELGVLEGLGLTGEDVVDSLEGYYDRCRELLTDSGVGECTISLMVYGEDAMTEILEAVDANGYEAGYLKEVVKALRLKSFRFSLGLVAEELSGGYYLVTQESSLR